MNRLMALGAVACLVGCDPIFAEPDFERMLHQDKGMAYAPSPHFDDGMVMQAPPAHTVPFDPTSPTKETNEPWSSALGAAGAAGAARAATTSRAATTATGSSAAPPSWTRRQLDVGRQHYATHCTPCHGHDGRANTVVAQHMNVRKPPSLVVPPVSQTSATHVYSVITRGYGLMPDYAYALTPSERWSVVGFVRALQVAAETDLKGLPDEARRIVLDRLTKGEPTDD